MPAFFPEGDTPIPFDLEQRSLQKIVSLVGGGGGSGGASVTVGSGAPVAAGTSGDLYWDSVNKNMYVYDSDGWNIH
jgi:hypothetical protein